MKATIHYLQAMLSTLETNEPINRNAGNTEQADLESRDAAELRCAIAILAAVERGPIWPEPQAR